MSNQGKETTLSTLINELEEANKAPKCYKCGCFHQALEQLAAAPAALQEGAQEELSQVLKSGNDKLIPEEYECLGCSICWPANALNLAADAFPELTIPHEESCPSDTPARQRSWPTFPGNYQVLDTSGHVAVCTLTSDSLIEALAAAEPAGLAIVGALYTENLGIERMVTNLLANPNITTLLVCGTDSQQRIGHYAGQTLISLVEHGVNNRGRVIDAKGRRPVLRNLTPQAITVFRKEITVIDRTGDEDTTALSTAIEQCPRGKLRRAVVRTDNGAPVILSQPPPHLVLDPKGYFIVFPDRGSSKIVVEHYENDGTLTHIFEGKRTEELYSTVLTYDLVSRLDHAAYIGKEFALAEKALRTGEPYVQDQAPEPPRRTGCDCSSSRPQEEKT